MFYLMQQKLQQKCKLKLHTTAKRSGYNCIPINVTGTIQKVGLKTLFVGHTQVALQIPARACFTWTESALQFKENYEFKYIYMCHDTTVPL